MPLGRALGSRLGSRVGASLGAAPNTQPGTTLFQLFLAGSTEATAYSGGTITPVTGQTVTCAGSAGRTMEDENGVVYVTTSNQPRVVSRSGQLMLLVEPTVTNACLQSSTLSNASWVKTNMSCSKNATGPTDVANSATTCTANANNATVLQAITHASAIRSLTCRLKRVSGSGTVEITLNGSSWIDVTASLASNRYTRMTPDGFSGLSVTQTNASVGIRMGTSGDVIEAAFFQYEAPGALLYYSSDIETTTVGVSRGNESVTITNPLAATNPTRFFLQASALPYTTAGTWTFNGNKGVMSLGAYAAANTLGFLVPASGRFQITAVDGSSGTRSWVLNPPSPLAAGAHQLVHVQDLGSRFASYMDGVAVAPAQSGAGTGIIATQGASSFIGGTSTAAGFQGYLYGFKIGSGNWPPRAL